MNLTSTEALDRASAAFKAGQHDEAVRLLQAVLEAHAGSPRALILLAAILAQRGQLPEALARYQQALSARPDDPVALRGCGDVLFRLRRFGDALACYDAALRRNPVHPGTLNNRGLSLHELGRYDEALDTYSRLLGIAADMAGASYNRALTLLALRRRPEALADLDRALMLQPDYFEAHLSRAAVLRDLGRAIDAMLNNERAMQLRPGDVGGLYSRAMTLFECHRYVAALGDCDRALMSAPDRIDVLMLRGMILRAMNRVADAAKNFDAAILLRPDHGPARFARCMADLPVIYFSATEIETQRAAYEVALRQLDAAAGTRIGLADLAAGIGQLQPFLLAYQGRNDRDLQALYGSIVCRAAAARYGAPVAAPMARADEPIRVGIVSGFFRMHSNWKLPVRGWLGQLDRRRFRLYGYHTGARTDRETEIAAGLCTRFVQGPLSIDRWRQEILSDAPHVLIYPEIGMDPVAPALAAQRLAAVQCNSWGHPDTSGFPTIDYYLSSDRMEPPDGYTHYTEKLIPLPNLSTYYEPLPPPVLRLERKRFGVRPDAVVYWCCQAMFKYLPQYDEVFPRIAKAAGNCQFVFIQDDGRPHVTALFRLRIERAFAAAGLSAAFHVVFVPRLKTDEFSALSALCDVFLDSLGWSGGNTTLESLTHALPIVTMPGPTMRSRHSKAVLEMLGITETIAATVDEYVAMAARLATDAAWRKSISARIAANRNRVYYDRVAIAGLETFLERVARAP